MRTDEVAVNAGYGVPSLSAYVSRPLRTKSVSPLTRGATKSTMKTDWFGNVRVPISHWTVCPMIRVAAGSASVRYRAGGGVTLRTAFVIVPRFARTREPKAGLCPGRTLGGAQGGGGG